MKKIKFIVIRKKHIPINWNPNESLVHEDHLFSFERFEIHYEYVPTSKFEKSKVIDNIENQLKFDFRPCNVEVIKSD